MWRVLVPAFSPAFVLECMGSRRVEISRSLPRDSPNDRQTDDTNTHAEHDAMQHQTRCRNTMGNMIGGATGVSTSTVPHRLASTSNNYFTEELDS